MNPLFKAKQESHSVAKVSPGLDGKASTTLVLDI